VSFPVAGDRGLLDLYPVACAFDTMIECKTICVRCKYHKGWGVWYNHYCEHPSTARNEEQDPVTGEISYGIRNDLGRVVLTDKEFPHCRDINHGNCPNFEKES